MVLFCLVLVSVSVTFHLMFVQAIFSSILVHQSDIKFMH